jgi:DNA invertase Pin-like site-specific DNA recombinase
MPPRATTKEQDEQIARLYYQNHPMREIASRIGVGTTLVHRRLRSMGLVSRPQGRKPYTADDPIVRQVVAMRAKGVTYRQIADALNMGSPSMPHRLFRVGSHDVG